LIADRYVTRVDPSDEGNSGTRLFSSFLTVPNIVLLGDPGAGKTHLFNFFANQTGGKTLHARDFLNLDPSTLSGFQVLFIDALDEKRAGRGDQRTVDSIIRKLLIVKPGQLRIACRASDWLGAIDLAAFAPYFQANGGHTVLSLAPMSEGEQQEVLRSRGVANADAFLAEAKRRGLDELLGNPQNLVMLADVVAQGAWPSSRFELFDKAVDVLLSEHNPHRTVRSEDAFSPKELRDAAGALCAVRIVSDIDGISISDFDSNPRFPSYRRIELNERVKLKAALSRRAFVAGPAQDVFDYSHRTIAEFLAARWLVDQVRGGGLPLGRVRTLLGVDGRPSSELRGLHAWLAILLPEDAEILIRSDPFGVLSYGDARHLSPTSRRVLLSALAALQSQDPWFRGDNWSTHAIAGLSAPDMADAFRDVLRRPDAGHSLRTVVLDALAEGEPIAALSPELLAIIADPSLSYAERYRAVDALFRCGDEAQKQLVSTFKGLQRSPNDVRLRSHIIQKLSSKSFGAGDLLALLADAVELGEELPTGALWRLDNAIADDEIANVLDALSQLSFASAFENARDAGDALHFFDALIARYLTRHPDISGKTLAGWLGSRARLAPYQISRTGTVHTMLKSNEAALVRLIDFEVEQMSDQDSPWTFYHNLCKLSLFSISDDLLLARLKDGIKRTEGQKRSTLYPLALSLAFGIGPPAYEQFVDLVEFAEGDDSLVAARLSACSCPLDDWRVADARRRIASQDEKSAQQHRNRHDFEKASVEIRTGTHLAWLSWLGRIYYAEFADVDREALPHQRLVHQLGEANAKVALDGFVAVASRMQVTALADVVHLERNSQWHPWWLAMKAGLDELAAAGVDLSRFPPQFIESMIAIDCIHPVFVHKGNTSTVFEHAWKRFFVDAHPQLAISAYEALARSALERSTESIYGLHELLSTESLAANRAEKAKALLRDYPDQSWNTLRRLVPAALEGSGQREIADLARRGIAGTIGTLPRTDAYILWLALGYTYERSQFQELVTNLDPADRTRFIWSLRDVLTSTKWTEDGPPNIGPDRLVEIARLTAAAFPRSEHPTTGWSGDTNPWDASEFVQGILNRLALDGSSSAMTALQALATCPELATYREHALHASSVQLVRRIDSQFNQPSFESALEVFSKGRPVSSADLQALVLAHLDDIGVRIASGNSDAFKRFWNENGRGGIKDPKPEESARDVLLDLLRERLYPLSLTVEPEGHMARDKRADIVISQKGLKGVIEIKRQSHGEVWTAINTQLDRLYARDPDTQGCGVYCVLWYGSKHRPSIRACPDCGASPGSAREMQSRLQALVPPDRAAKIRAIVIDVSGKYY